MMQNFNPEKFKGLLIVARKMFHLLEHRNIVLSFCSQTSPKSTFMRKPLKHNKSPSKIYISTNFIGKNFFKFKSMKNEKQNTFNRSFNNFSY